MGLKVRFSSDCDFRVFQSLTVTKGSSNYPTKRVKEFCKGFSTEDLIADSADWYSHDCMQEAVQRAIQLSSELDDSPRALKLEQALTAYSVGTNGSKELWVAIDSGAGKGLISNETVAELKAPTKPSNSEYLFITANGEIQSKTELN